MTVYSMFPIIPAHLSGRPCFLPLPQGPPLTPDHGRKLQVSVVAAVDIPAHATSQPIPLDSIIRARVDRDKYEVRFDDSGLLEAKDESVAWVRHTRVSSDCHSCNVIVHRVRITDQSAVRLQTVREIKAGEQLRLWFDEDVLAAAAIPFLTPNNIQGEKNYICHQCRKRFEYPNPLKMHLALECGTLRRVEIWKRLKNEDLKPVPKDDLSVPKVFNTKMKKKEFSFEDLTQSFSTARSSPDKSSFSMSSSPSPFMVPKSDEETDRPSSEPILGRYSAFKPYLSFHNSTAEQLDFKSSPLVTVPSNLIYSSTHFSSRNLPRAGVQPPPTMGCADFGTRISLIDQQAVEMETLVSNLGRSKQGHLCIYCGKVYSRKYGLKIHIRTHTGFKPLKCKFCLRPFGDPSNLNKHVRLHAEGETPYKCDECGKVLVRRRDLERHLKSRHQPNECV